MNKIIACLLCLCLAGCAPKPAGIVGTWTGTRPLLGGGETTVKFTATFRADGTATETSESPVGRLSRNFTYARSGDTLTLTPASASPPIAFRFRQEGDALTLDETDGGTHLDLHRVP